jgi:hypothetical protein
MERMIEPKYRRVMQRIVIVPYQVHTASWVIVGTGTPLGVCT